MYFPNAFKKTFLLPSGTVTVNTSAATSALAAGEVGLYNQAYRNLSTASGSVPSVNTPFYIVMGSYFTSDKISPALGGYKESVKSKLINPKYVTRFFTVAAKKPQQQVVKIALTNAGLPQDTTVRLRVDVKGSPALRFLSHNIYRTMDAYTGCFDGTTANLVDPIPTLLAWKDQINASPYLNNMIQARVYKYVTTGTATNAVATTSQVTLTVTNTNMLVGQHVTGTGIPANAFITSLISTTGIVVKFPVQQTAPTISTTVVFKTYSDLYNDVTAQGLPTIVGTATYIAGTGTQTGVGGSAVVSNGIATGATIATSASGALIYSAGVNATSFTNDCMIELTAAYIETKFGSCTFTPTDMYDIAPLNIYTSVTDESGDPCLVSVFGSTGALGNATEVQAPIQASGIGETVLRDLILSDRYAQIAYPDSSHVDHLRMREIEADPALATIDRNAFYDKIYLLHSVPRFYNPTGSFDNDQYLVEIVVPTGVDYSDLTTRIGNLLQSSGNFSVPYNFGYPGAGSAGSAIPEPY
jgi:hypothetical protein